MADLTLNVNMMIAPIMQAIKTLGATSPQAIAMAESDVWRRQMSHVSGGEGGRTRGARGAMGGSLAGLADIGDVGSIDDFNESLRNLFKVGDQATKSIKNMKKSKDKLDKNLKETAETTGRFTAKIVAMGGELRSVSRLFFYASLDLKQFTNVVLGPMKEGVLLFEEYNKTMTMMKVNFESLRGTGEESIALLDQRFKDLAESTEFSRMEIAKGAAVFGTAGVAVDEISESLERLADLARINFTDMEAVAKITLRTMRRFKLSMEEAQTEMWRLTAMSQLTGESITEIANQMGYAVEMGQELGFSFGEIVSNMTVLTEVYGSSSIAGRRLSSVYASLIDKGEEYGVQLRSVNGELLSNRDQIANLVDYMDLIGDPLEQNQYLMELFGKSGASTARTLIDAFKSGTLDKAMAETGDNMVETMQQLSKTIEEELYVSLQDLRSEIGNLKLALGEELAPAIKANIGPITDAIQGFQKWIAENGEFITSIGALALGMFALATAIQTAGFIIEIVVALSTAIEFFIPLMVAAAGAIDGFLISVAMAIFGMGSLTSVIGGAIAAIIAAVAPILVIIGVIILLIGFIAGLAQGVSDAMDQFVFIQPILDIFAAVLEIIIRPIIMIVKILLTIGAVIGWVAGMIAGFILALAPLQWILTVIADVLQWVADVFEFWGGVLDDVIAALGPGSPTLAQRFFELGDSVRSTLGPMKEAVLWGRRLNNSVGDVKAQVILGYGKAAAEAMALGGSPGGETSIINVDAAYVQSPRELANIISDRQTEKSRRHFRRAAY